MAKKHAGKFAIKDKTTGKNVTYSRALIGALILCSKFKKYDKGFIGIMIPTSAGCALATVGALMSGRIPVMINYSTGAEGNAKYAQNKCRFKTIITSRALLEKIDCPVIDGMVLIEDIMESVSTGDKLKAAFKTKLFIKEMNTTLLQSYLPAAVKKIQKRYSCHTLILLQILKILELM
jgi:acyl-[acyl-carrier-protein]-phospholipid O-acyltransferase/long-chain-fatty-acid--[acyl-carrier-protein] ligase